MPWDGTPWMVGGNVKHSTNIARLLAYVAFGGREGIIDPTDLYVRARAVPADSIRVAPGACSILNRALNIESEAYAARLPTEDYVNVAPTGSGGWRTDLIVARVENPFLTGEPYAAPSAEDIAAGNVQFVFTRVIPGILSGASGAPLHPSPAQVAAAIAGQSAIPLASVAMPASTATVQQAYLKDQRSMAQFREETVMRVVNVASSIPLTSAYKTIASLNVDVPLWATHFTVAVLGAGVLQTTGSAGGYVRGALGATATDPTQWNSVVANTDRIVVAGGSAETLLPVAMRGTQQALTAQMNKTAGTGNLSVDTDSSVRLDVVFSSKPEALAA